MEQLTSSTRSTVVSFFGAGALKRFSSRTAAWSGVAFWLVSFYHVTWKIRTSGEKGWRMRQEWWRKYSRSYTPAEFGHRSGAGRSSSCRWSLWSGTLGSPPAPQPAAETGSPRAPWPSSQCQERQRYTYSCRTSKCMARSYTPLFIIWNRIGKICAQSSHTPSRAVHDLALHEVVDVLELLLSTRQRLWNWRDVQPFRRRNKEREESYKSVTVPALNKWFDYYISTLLHKMPFRKSYDGVLPCPCFLQYIPRLPGWPTSAGNAGSGMPRRTWSRRSRLHRKSGNKQNRFKT